MSGPPPPPHLTENYQQLLSLNQGYSPPPAAPSTNAHTYSSSNIQQDGRFKQRVGQYRQQQHYQHHQQRQRFQPYKRASTQQAHQLSGCSSLFQQHRTTKPVDGVDADTVAKETEIVNLLKQFPRPLSTKEIVQNCGHFYQKPIQGILHSLYEQGLIVKQPGYGLEAWKYNKNPPSPSPSPLSLRNQTSLTSPSYRENQSQQIHEQQSWRNTSPNMPRNQTSFPSPQPPPLIGSKTTNNKQLRKQANFMISTDMFNALNKNPVSALNELAQKNGVSISLELLCESKTSKSRFTVAAMVDGRMYDAVSAPNMKEAKRDAADAALKTILQEYAKVNDEHQLSSSTAQAISTHTTATSTHFDRIAALSHRTFIEKSSLVQEKFAGRKVIACMIMKRNYEDTGVAVALGTGNRCITGQRLSMEGKVVNDSHAEIICRRAFISFLYSELEKHFTGACQSDVFEAGGYGGKSKLRDGITFHLYISTAPCGDGALFTPRQNNNIVSEEFPLEHTPTFTAKSHGILRSKIEDGEGTIPIDESDARQTFDGILRGERLRTMSCSDKICRWNVLGLQGALLSLLIDPIYLDSLTLGYLYDHGHLARSICCRLDKGADKKENGVGVKKMDETLPMPYYLNHPWIGRVTQCKVSRETEKTNNISINWCLYDQAPEVTDGRTGAQLGRTDGAPTPSQLCKLEFMKRFQSLVGKKPEFAHLRLGVSSSYKELKDQAIDFQQAKQCMLDRIRLLKYGPWVEKPVEQDMF